MNPHNEQAGADGSRAECSIRAAEIARVAAKRWPYIKNSTADVEGLLTKLILEAARKINQRDLAQIEYALGIMGVAGVSMDMILSRIASLKSPPASPVGQDALAALSTAKQELNFWLEHCRDSGLSECAKGAKSAIKIVEAALASASHANPTSGGPGAGGVADPFAQENMEILNADARRMRGEIARLERELATLCEARTGDVPKNFRERLTAFTQWGMYHYQCSGLTESDLQADIGALLTAAKSTPPQGDVFCRRWTFENRGGEIWVCKGDHKKCSPCDFEELSAAATIKLIEELRSLLLAKPAQAPAPSRINAVPDELVPLADQLLEQHGQTLQKAPSSDAVEDKARLDWLEDQSALCEESDGTRYNEWRVEMPPEFRGDVRAAIDLLRAGRDGAVGKVHGPTPCTHCGGNGWEP